MFPVETVKEIQSKACEAQSAKLMPELSGDGRKMFVQQGTEIKEFLLEPAPRSHQVHTLVDLILYARREDNKAPVVWHGRSGVVLLTDDVDRRDRVEFCLDLSDRLSSLRRIDENRADFDQAKFIRLLRIDLGLDNEKVVQQFRKLDWQCGTEGVGEVQHGQDRLGKAVTARIAGVEQLPDELNVPTPIYQQIGERTEYVVKCAIEIDTVNQQFQLCPLPDELQRVMDLAQADIHQRLIAALGKIDGQTAIPVYYGRP